MSDYVRELRRQLAPGVVLQVPSAAVAVRDRAGKVLLARHSEVGAWVLPGGAIEPGESPAEAAVREAREEIGLAVSLTRLVGVFGGPDFLVEYLNGDRTSYVMTVFEATSDGEAQPDGVELLELRFVGPGEPMPGPCARWLPPVLAAVWGKDP